MQPSQLPARKSSLHRRQQERRPSETRNHRASNPLAMNPTMEFSVPTMPPPMLSPDGLADRNKNLPPMPTPMNGTRNGSGMWI